MITQKKYAPVIFLYDYEDSEVDKLLNQDFDLDELARYLSSWDYGEYHEINDTPGKGKADDYQEINVKYAGDYLLSWNTALGYVSLEAIILEDFN